MRANGRPPEDDLDPYEKDEHLEDLLPGDVLDFWMEESMVIETVFRCWETMDSGTVQWRWLFLDDDSLLEISPDGLFRYKEHHILKQGTAEYEEIVAQDGALVRFEERVREGTSGRRPVQITVADHEFQITSSGTVAVERFGPVPEPITWRYFDPKSSEYVYFGLYDVADETNVAVGLWTAHVCVSIGKEIQRSDITAIYRNREKK
jgi:hypothetical protein